MLAVSLILPACVSQAANTIDFEDWNVDAGYLVSGGFHFSGIVSVSIDPASGNTTNALHCLSLRFKAIPISENLFSIHSLDLQEGIGATGTVAIQLVGHFPFPAGGVVQTFILDGNPATYERFYPVGFVGLEGVHLYGFDASGRASTGFSVDNVVIPEPGSLCLLFPATALLRRRP